MNDNLKAGFDALLELINKGLYAEAVAQINNLVKGMPVDTMRAYMATMTKKQVVDFWETLALGWKEANAISKAEAEKFIAVVMAMLQFVLAAAFNQD